MDAYATSDLLVPHPTKPDLWKIYGRKDDQIMLSTGEKTNPGPLGITIISVFLPWSLYNFLEGILAQDPHILSAVMFGRGRFQNGVLIDPKPQFAFDPKDETKLEAFRKLIWQVFVSPWVFLGSHFKFRPTVERLNDFAPQHSRLFKEARTAICIYDTMLTDVTLQMIIVASPSKPFVYTAKMTARRQAILKDYDEEINALYDVVEQTSQVDIPIPAEWTPSHSLDYIRHVVQKVMTQNVADEVDIFQHGCDR